MCFRTWSNLETAERAAGALRRRALSARSSRNCRGSLRPSQDIAGLRRADQARSPPHFETMPLSTFQPAIQRWFAERLGDPTPSQREGWPAIRAGKNTLIAAPTGSGKTLAAFLSALDDLLSQGAALEERTQVLYISPLKALARDIQKNLETPLAEIRALDPSLPELRVSVRTGDTSAKGRASMS